MTDQIKLYWRDDDQAALCAEFLAMTEEIGITDKLFFPNKAKAPWHVQAHVNGTLINFYPHRETGYVVGTPDGAIKSRTLYSFAEMRAAIIEALQSDHVSDDFDLMERDT